MIGHYNPLVRIIDLVFTPLTLRVLIFYINGGTYSLTPTPNDRFFEKLFIEILFTLKPAERKSPKKYFFLHIVLMSDLAFEP